MGRIVQVIFLLNRNGITTNNLNHEFSGKMDFSSRAIFFHNIIVVAVTFELPNVNVKEKSHNKAWGLGGLAALTTAFVINLEFLAQRCAFLRPFIYCAGTCHLAYFGCRCRLLPLPALCFRESG
jgi:hypothetical protein